MDEVRLGGSHLTRVVDADGDTVDITDHKISYEHGGVEVYTIEVAKQESGDASDDLTVIMNLGPAAATWLEGYGIKTFATLASLSDGAVDNLAHDSEAPKGVTRDRLADWRTDAAGQ